MTERSGDPFLEAHRFGDLAFDISGRSPGSIRDQMLRALMIVDRAARAGLIGPGRPLAVVGAGAAGVTATMSTAVIRWSG